MTIDDLAAHADVAPRTFFNYFSSKDEAILADGVERAQRMVSTLAQRPPAEPVWDALRNSFVEVIAEDVEPSREWVARGRLVRASPALASQYLANYATMERMLIDEVARRCDCVARRPVSAAGRRHRRLGGPGRHQSLDRNDGGHHDPGVVHRVGP